MKLSQLGKMRLASQQIESHEMKTPQQLVEWMGAMQAQDYNMAKWAVGLRLNHCTEKDIETALDRGSILRTHILRPTWHFVSSKDIYWMLELTAPRLIALLKSRHHQLGLTEKIFVKSNSIIEKVLAKEKHLTRDELVKHLQSAKISTENEKKLHLLFRAELNGIICSGPKKGKELTYALLHERVNQPKKIEREDALAKLALKYFSSHGPATVQDFAWWSGLSLTDAKHGIEMQRSKLSSEKIDADTYWFLSSINMSTTNKSSAYLLPAFDEFMISYKNRQAVIGIESHSKAVSSNGIFWPIIVVNGLVTGKWKRSFQKEGVKIEKDFFAEPTKVADRLLRKAEKAFKDFLKDDN